MQTARRQNSPPAPTTPNIGRSGCSNIDWLLLVDWFVLLVVWLLMPWPCCCVPVLVWGCCVDNDIIVLCLLLMLCFFACCLFVTSNCLPFVCCSPRACFCVVPSGVTWLAVCHLTGSWIVLQHDNPAWGEPPGGGPFLPSPFPHGLVWVRLACTDSTNHLVTSERPHPSESHQEADFLG